MVESSLGYYINPLFTIFLGVTVLRERLDRWQIAALSLGFLGVVVLTVQYGQVPWISLLLAVTFGLYGLSKKKVKMLIGCVLVFTPGMAACFPGPRDNSRRKIVTFLPCDFR